MIQSIIHPSCLPIFYQKAFWKSRHFLRRCIGIVAREAYLTGNTACATSKFAERISVCVYYTIVAREAYLTGNTSCATSKFAERISVCVYYIINASIVQYKTACLYSAIVLFLPDPSQHPKRIFFATKNPPISPSKKFSKNPNFFSKTYWQTQKSMI